MTITVSVTILPDGSSAPAAAAAPFDGSRLRKLAEIATAVLDLLSKLGVKVPAAQPPAANL